MEKTKGLKIIEALRTWGKDLNNEATTQRTDGSVIVRSFASLDRYVWDFAQDFRKKFQQFDTGEDASYYGVWVNPTDFEIFRYQEGDISLLLCQTKEQYNEEIKGMIAFHDEGKICSVVSEEGMTTFSQDRQMFVVA